MEMRRKKSGAALATVTEAETAPVAAQAPARRVQPLLALAGVPQTIETQAVAAEHGLAELMAQALKERERAQAVRKRVREINSEIITHRGAWPAALRETYGKAVEELSAALGATNRSRAQLIAALRRFGQSPV